MLATIPDQTGTVGTQVSFTATATDAAGQELTFSLATDDTPAQPSMRRQVSFPGLRCGWNVYLRVRVNDNGTPSLSDQEDVTITVT